MYSFLDQKLTVSVPVVACSSFGSCEPSPIYQAPKDFRNKIKNSPKFEELK